MAASISTKKGSIAGDFLKRTTGLITGAAGDYIKDVMPVTTSTITEATSTISSASNALSKNMQAIMPSLKQMKVQTGLKDVFRWFMQSEDDFGDIGSIDFDSSLDFDIDLEESSSAKLTEIEISESEASSNKISKAVVESGHHMMEGHMQLTANIVTSVDQQSNIISTGFDRTHEILNNILEIVTKNTSTAIEATVAAASKENPTQSMLSSGKFSLSEYKKILQGNIKNHPELGMITAFMPMLLNPTMLKQMATPEALTSGILSSILDAKAPNLRKNMEALDSAISDTVLNSLIRLGENNSWSESGKLSRLFGIDSRRQDISNTRSSLELKAVPFDSIAHESITNAIPGYLRKILNAISGEDVVYDYQGRKFSTKATIKKDYLDASTASGSLGSASRQVRESFGYDSFGSMIYDLMVTDLGNKTAGGEARRQIEGFTMDPSKFTQYIEDLYKNNNLTMSDNERARVDQMGSNISKHLDTNISTDISNQIAMINVNRNRKMSSYLSTANAYNMDLSDVKSNADKEVQNILRSHGRIQSNAESEIKSTGNIHTGTFYSNKALYEIFRVLNRGINVFQVGSSNIQTDPYPERGNEYLSPPVDYRPKATNDIATGQSQNTVSTLSGENTFDEPNLLQNQELEDGTTEELSKGQRFVRWGKERGGNLRRALFSGSPEQVREAFSLIMRDVTEVTGEQVKAGAARINDQFGNVTGYLKHKIFGHAYSYTDEDGNRVYVAENEKGGYFGFVKDYVKDMFAGTKDKAAGWFKEVAGYFDYGDKDEDNSIVNKRKKLISASVGAFAGAGILGGPIGLIMGAVAGNALSGMDIGSKIKDLFIGRDEKGRAKGLLTRLTDGIVDPIKFQIGKTAQHIGDNLKKNILGPLSDIGVAIKDRIANSAESHFGKVFKFIGNMMLSPLKGLLNIAKAPIAMIGGATRGASSAGTGIIGAGLSSIANSIAGKNKHTYVDEETGEEKTVSTKSFIRSRRKDRAASIKDERAKDDKYADYKTYKAAENERRSRWAAKVKEYTHERVLTPEEVAANEAAVQTAQDTSEIREGVTTLAELGSEKGSIYTHDEGLHTRIDEIINTIKSWLPGSIKKTAESESSENNSTIGQVNPELHGIADMFKGDDFRTSAEAAPSDDLKDTVAQSARHEEDEGFANSTLGMAATLASEGHITTTDQRLVNQIIAEAAKDDSNKSVLAAKSRELLQSQEEIVSEEKEEKSSFFEKITEILGGDNGILNNLIKWGGILTAIHTILGAFGNMDNIADQLRDSWEEFWGSDKSDDPVTSGVNTVLNTFDAEVNDKTDLFNPFTNVYHNDTDASGEQVIHQGATEAKNDYLLYTPLKQSITKPAYQAYKYTRDSVNYMNMADDAYAEASDLTRRARIAEMDGDVDGAATLRQQRDQLAAQSADYYQRAQDADADAAEARSQTGKGALDEVVLNAKRVGVMTGVSTIAGEAASYVGDQLGLSEENSERLGDYVTAGTTAGLIVNQGVSAIKGKKSVIDKGVGLVDNIIEILKKFFNFLATKFKAVNALKSFGGKITSFFDDICRKTTGKVTSTIAEKITAKLTAKLGAGTAKQAISALGVGVPIAIGAISGIASGLCSVEHLFNVAPGEADATMKAIAAVQKGVFEALEWTPAVGFIVSALDIIDQLIILGLTGKTLQQYIAEFLYKLIAGEEGAATLAEKQGEMTAQKDKYNAQYGTDLNSSTFNDLVNNGSWVDKVLRGGMKKDEEGNFVFDDAGGRIDGGLKGAVIGGEKQYVKNEEGVVVRDAEGKAIRAVDAEGNELYKDEKFGAKIGKWANSVGRFFTGGDVYETDENGVAKVDAEGNYVVKETKGNLIERTGAALSNAGDSIKEFTENIGDKAKKGFSDFKSSAATLFSYVKKGDIKGLLSSKSSEVDTDSPISGFGSAVYNAGKIFVTVPTLISAAGHGIADKVTGVVKKVKDFGSTISAEREYANKLLTDKSSNFSDLFKVEDEDPDNPVGDFMKVTKIASRLSIIPTALVKRVGGIIGDKISKIVSVVKNDSNQLSTSVGNLTQYISAGDLEGLKTAEFVDNDENPVGKLTRSIFNGVRFVSFVPAGLSWIGHKIADKFNAVKEKVSNSFTTLGTNHDTLNAISKTGDFTALGAATMEMDPENPVGGFTQGIFNVDKFLHYVPTGLHWVGNSVSSKFNAVKEKVSNSFGALTQNHESISQFVKDGDVTGLLGLDFEDDPENPVGGFTKAIFTVDKYLNVPSAGLHWVGAKVKEKFTAMLDTIGEAKTTLDTNVDSIEEYAKAGDFEGIKSLEYEDNSENPLGGIMKAMFGVAKLINYPRAGIHVIGNKIKEGFEGISTKVSSNKSTLDTALSDLADSAKDGDVNAVWSKELTLEDGDPLSAIWKVSFTISKLFNSAVAIVSSIGNWIEDAIDSVKEKFSGGLEKFWDWLGGSGGDSEGVGGPRIGGAVPFRSSMQPAYGGIGGSIEGGNPLNKSYSVSSGFGKRRHPYEGYHYGVDLIPRDGSKTADVESRFSGTISKVERTVADNDTAHKDANGKWSYSGNKSGGNEVWIDTDNGKRVKNMHLAAGSIPSSIKPGARVEVGTKIGRMGSTGWSTGAHLHYQIENDVKLGRKSAINPIHGEYQEIDNDSRIGTGGTSDGIFNQLISKIQEVGTGFLNLVTGGLFSNNSSSSSSSISGSSGAYSGGVGSAADFLAMCAAEIGTTENPPGSNKVKYNTWYYGKEVSGDSYPWCMAFVQWCFNNAGLTLPHKTASCSQLMNWYKSNQSDKVHTSNPKPGDIIIWTKSTSSMSHTGIVEEVLGNGYIQTIEGNTSASDAGSQSNGGCVARKKRKMSEVTVYIRAVDFSNLQTSLSSISSVGEGAEELWKYFKGLGYSDHAIAGVLGCWTKESGNRSKRVEWDYSNSFKTLLGYDKVLNDRSAMDNYTQALFNQYASQGLSIDRAAYKASDGHYYPGIGYAQWTGPRGKALLDFARSNNLDWGDSATQLAFLDTELKGSYSGVRPKIENASSPEEAARLFCKYFEGYSGDSSSRQSTARSLYNQLKGKYGTGGSIEDENYDFESQNAQVLKDPSGKILEVQADPGNIEDGIGGPTDSSIGTMNNYATTQRKSIPKVTPSDNYSVTHTLNQSNSPIIKASTPVTSDNSYQHDVIQGTDLSGVIGLMKQVVSELVKISTNTGSSNTLLTSLNEKEFVDQGLRDSINALGKSKSKSFNKGSSSYSSARSVTAMARP